MHLSFQETLSNAWQRVDGAKATIWAGIGIFLPIIALIVFLNMMIENNFFLNLLTDLLFTLFNAGLVYLGIKRAQDFPIQYTQIFYPLHPGIILRLVVVAIVKYIITLIPILIFIFLVALLLQLFSSWRETILIIAKPVGLLIVVTSLIYLQIRMILSTAFILDRHADFWSAIQLSFQATRGQFWHLFLLYLFTLFSIMLSIIPFGVGLIWSLPFAFILYGTIYKEMATPSVKPSPAKRAFDA